MLIVTLHAPIPVQAPDQPVNTLVASCWAASVTTWGGAVSPGFGTAATTLDVVLTGGVPSSNVAVTVPPATPFVADVETVSANVDTWNCAPTLADPLIVSVQVGEAPDVQGRFHV